MSLASGSPGQLAELFRFIEASVRSLSGGGRGGCLPYGEGITFWALGEIVKAEAGILEGDPPDVAIVKLEPTIPPDDPDREWLKVRLLPLLGIASVPAEREENFTAWRRYLEHLAAGDPSVFVIEDLHWADPALLAFIEHVAEYVEGVSILLICTARPELFEREANWGGGKRNSTIISLSPLTDAESGSSSPSSSVSRCCRWRSLRDHSTWPMGTRSWPRSSCASSVIGGSLSGREPAGSSPTPSGSDFLTPCNR